MMAHVIHVALMNLVSTRALGHSACPNGHLGLKGLAGVF